MCQSPPAANTYNDEETDLMNLFLPKCQISARKLGLSELHRGQLHNCGRNHATLGMHDTMDNISAKPRKPVFSLWPKNVKRGVMWRLGRMASRFRGKDRKKNLVFQVMWKIFIETQMIWEAQTGMMQQKNPAISDGIVRLCPLCFTCFHSFVTLPANTVPSSRATRSR